MWKWNPQCQSRVVCRSANKNKFISSSLRNNPDVIIVAESFQSVHSTCPKVKALDTEERPPGDLEHHCGHFLLWGFPCAGDDCGVLPFIASTTSIGRTTIAVSKPACDPVRTCKKVWSALFIGASSDVRWFRDITLVHVSLLLCIEHQLWTLGGKTETWDSSRIPVIRWVLEFLFSTWAAGRKGPVVSRVFPQGGKKELESKEWTVNTWFCEFYFDNQTLIRQNVRPWYLFWPLTDLLFSTLQEHINTGMTFSNTQKQLVFFHSCCLQSTCQVTLCHTYTCNSSKTTMTVGTKTQLL